ncbi:cyclin-dependent kinase inhibitor 1B-like [Seriola dumerili]|uniref:Cyclin-dependent kinase inhibitor 1B-like n=1 Tax=Seriola dumerili TaxID=41447 RepID=A0A3B4UT52_SERDU|nr:cyclin-dependent kinase inhibitor 1B-like [Seriola dumerili]
MTSTRRRESVCRSLFGPVDHEQLRRDLTLKLREMTEQDSRRWNFNFQADVPLLGRFEWEEMPADRAAAFYQESAQLKDALGRPNTEDDDRLSDREGSAGADQENCSRISNTRKCPAEVTPVRRKRTLSKAAAAAKPRDNARITDFFPKRRRTTETKSILNPPHTSSSEAALCKTIR